MLHHSTFHADCHAVDFFQVMDTFQKNLLNNNFELIATELFSDDPKLQIENLKVRFQTQRSISASVRRFLDIVKLFSTQKMYERFDIVGRHRWPSTFQHRHQVNRMG